jgi:hypothetical protein
MINFNIGDLVWILEDSLGHSDAYYSVIPHYKTKKPNYGIVTGQEDPVNGWVKVSFWDETSKSLLFKEKNLRKHEMEVSYDKACRSC